MAEGTSLLRMHTLTGIEGSNPSLSVGVVKNDSLFFSFGGVSEWPKEHAWKVCMHDKCIVSSNLTSSEIFSYFFIAVFLNFLTETFFQKTLFGFWLF